MRRIEITYKPVEELTPYDKNPRRNDEAVAPVAESIAKFGFKVPIVLDSEGVVVAGHTRLKAALKLGLETVPCIVADDLTAEQAAAFRLADNKTGEIAEWDEDLLEEELAELFQDIDMSEFGFEDEFSDLNAEDFGTDFELSAADEPQYKTITLSMTSEQYDVVTAAIDAVGEPTMTGGNQNADRVTEVCIQWAAR